MVHTYCSDLAERNYSLASTQLELANAQRHIKVAVNPEPQTQSPKP
jgi:hypothetical protein